MTVLKKTSSICPECNRILPAEVFERDGKVWISKNCPDHGEVEDLYYGSADQYRRVERYAHDGRGVYNPNITKENPVCPEDCGLCRNHKSHTALANLVVTSRCDLSCWYCFYYSKRLGYIYEPTIGQIEEMIVTIRSGDPIKCNAVQITGGEPALRNDLMEVFRLCHKHGLEHIQLNTNGIRLSKNVDFLTEARALEMRTLYLSFDGVTPRTNPKNHWEIPDILDTCRKADVGVVLVPTVIRGRNDLEAGDIIRFGFDNLDVVRGVNFQPVSLVGRITHADRMKLRITIPDVLEKIEEQTGGLVRPDDFFPVPTPWPVSRLAEALTGRPKYDLSSHFACGMGTYLFKDGEEMIPITRFVNVDGLLDFLTKVSGDIENGKSRILAGLKILFKLGSFIDRKKGPKNLNLGKLLFNTLIRHDYKSIGEFHYKVLFVGLMHFQDKYNFDIERIKRCCIHNVMTDGRLIPFCTFNVIPEWYRDAGQESQGLSFKEWEKRSGRRLKEDLYKRDIRALEASPLYQSTYTKFQK